MTAHDPQGALAASKSFVPATVVRSMASTRAEIPGSILFVDVVGFTARAGQLLEKGPEGLEAVLRVLGDHYGSLLARIEEHGGDAIRFVGDALIAVFEDGAFASGDGSARAAAACALAMQADSKRGSLPMRTIVTRGQTTLVTTEPAAEQRHFVLAGRPLDEIAAGLSGAEPGEVVVSADVAGSVGASGSLSPKRGAGGFARLESIEAPSPPARHPLPAATLEALRRFLPLPLRERVDLGLLDWLAEIRTITAVFVSLGHIDISRVPIAIAQARAAADRWQAFLKEVVVDDKGFTVVLATGVPPFAAPDDAVRAVRLSLDLADRLRAEGLSPSVGIATGRAFCGAVGAPLRREYALVGAAMNLASRLASDAGSRIVCDEETAKRAADRVAMDALEPRTLKGMRDPVRVFSPGRDVEGRAERGALVGRSEEQALVAAELAHAARGEATRAVVLVGEPGIGKSHLVESSVRAAHERGLAHLAASAVAEQRSSAYYPWRAVFTALLERGIEAALDPEDLPFAPLLSAVASIDLPDNEATQEMGGQVRAQRTEELLVRMVARRTRETPALLSFEDAHWADQASWSLLERLVAARPPGLFVLASTRPGPAVELASVENAGATQRTLDALSPSATRALLEARLATSEVGDAIADTLHARAAGNPLFIEQLALSLRESGAIVVEEGRARVSEGVDLASVALPSTVESAITGRFDRLALDVQLTVKTASVIGSVFDEDQLASIHPRVEDRGRVREHLASLERAELLSLEPARAGHAQAYRFRHDLVRDVAYGLMLFVQGRALHLAIARYHEEKHHAELPAFYALLAYHYQKAGDVDRAVDYLEREAVRAFSIGLARQSVAVGIDAASLLGVELPRDPAAAGPEIGRLVGATMAALAGRSPQDLASLPELEDARVRRTIKILLELAPLTFQAGRPELFAVIGLTCLLLTLEHGASAPDVYSIYSVAHRAIFSDVEGAFAWSSRVEFVHGWFHNHWMRPIATSVDDSRQAAEAGLSAGDILYGCYNLSAEVVYRVARGDRLEDVIDLARKQLARNGKRVVNAAFHCAHEMQVAKALAGATRSPLSLSDDEHDEERDIASICATDYYNQIGYYLASRVKLHALFGDPAGALGWAEKLAPLAPAISGQVAEIDLTLFRAIAAADTGALEVAERDARTIAQWAQRCPENFEHLDALVTGVLSGVRGAFDEGLSALERAAETAAKRGFVQHEALAWERAAVAARSAPGARVKERAGELRARAEDAYRRWGALAKVPLPA